MTDEYQRRYLEHRKRKPSTMVRVRGQWARQLRGRRSIRSFVAEVPDVAHTRRIMSVARLAPQSCNRQALLLKVAEGKKVGALLAGGEGWLEKAPAVILVFADLAAYKSPAEKDFMPWLDAGVMLYAIVDAATDGGIGSCIVNPHIRPENVEAFAKKFNPEGRLFCGAVALGYAAVIPECPEKKPMEELVEWPLT